MFRTLHMTKSVEGSPKRKVRLDCLRKVQEVMSSIFTRLASRAHTTSITQHQVAREQWREGKSEGSNEPCSSELREHQAHQYHTQTSVGTRKSTSTTSLPMRAQNVTPSMKRNQNLLRIRWVKRSTAKTVVVTTQRPGYWAVSGQSPDEEHVIQNYPGARLT